MANHSAVMVMTARGPDRILSEGGSQAWVLNPNNARKHDYLVTVQNQHNGRWGGATEPHGTAFLIGRIRDVVPADDDGGGVRYKIEISDYARINIPCDWKGRNPVRYISLDQLGIDPSKLDFQPMPPKTKPAFIEEEGKSEVVDSLFYEKAAFQPMAERKSDPLTILEAKERLATTLGVRVDQIRITIDV